MDSSSENVIADTEGVGSALDIGLLSGLQSKLEDYVGKAEVRRIMHLQFHSHYPAHPSFFLSNNNVCVLNKIQPLKKKKVISL